MKPILRKSEIFHFATKKKRLAGLFLLCLCVGLSCALLQNRNEEPARMVMGGVLQTQAIVCEDFLDSCTTDFETYFRPSRLPSLNTRISSFDFFDPYFQKKPQEISLPDTLLDTPENTILNYYSILRDAANPVEGKSAGCGTLGDDKIPYPVSYQFLSQEYQRNLPYDAYLETYKNILHINLIKYHQVPPERSNEGSKRYFVELETIEGTEKDTGVFAYYYGYVDLEKKENQYRITNIHYFGENFLCAPYHGWQWDAESNVQIRYGDWCKLIQGDVQKTQTDDIIRIQFDGTDGYQYCIVFFRLTNGTDLEVAQYRRFPGGTWKAITIKVEDCLENNKKVSQ
ncbi:hypothetical protein [Anaerotignum sp.]|uniref:hypothetical protein n=1 Tax=Anaerotignum sp. TaxID=2039241 RepID=UPI002714D17A|nr:hypothetical protein [Anaerotignum sp.]